MLAIAVAGVDTNERAWMGDTATDDLCPRRGALEVGVLLVGMPGASLDAPLVAIRASWPHAPQRRDGCCSTITAFDGDG